MRRQTNNTYIIRRLLESSPLYFERLGLELLGGCLCMCPRRLERGRLGLEVGIGALKLGLCFEIDSIRLLLDFGSLGVFGQGSCFVLCHVVDVIGVIFTGEIRILPLLLVSEHSEGDQAP